MGNKPYTMRGTYIKIPNLTVIMLFFVYAKRPNFTAMRNSR